MDSIIHGDPLLAASYSQPVPVSLAHAGHIKVANARPFTAQIVS